MSNKRGFGFAVLPGFALQKNGTPLQGYGYKSAHFGGRGIVALQQCDRLSLAR
ncbi:MAG: hypothetical protein ACR2P4_02690 [Gammaproteobacteria bacterium]